MKKNFTDSTVKEFLTDILSGSNQDIESLGYYFLMDDIFIPINKVEFYVGGIKVSNVYKDMFTVVDIHEKGMIWHKEEN